MTIETALIILSLILLLLMAFIIPLLFQVWRSAKNVAMTLETLNQSLPIILKNLEEITTNANHASQNIHDQIEAISKTVNRYRGIMGVMAGLRPVISKKAPFSLMGKLSLLSALFKGVKVFWEVLTADQSPKAGGRANNTKS